MIEKIRIYAPFLKGIVEKLNELIAAFRPFQAIKGDKYIKVTKSDENIQISLTRALTDSLGGGSVRFFSGSISVVGIVPTLAELQSALASVYSVASTTPEDGDIVNIFVGSVIKFRAICYTQTSGTTGSLFHPTFTVNSVTYYAHVTQTGLF